MSNNPNRRENSVKLREQAEAKLKQAGKTDAPISDLETRRLLHELRVHQIELEMQNEELIESRAQLEAGFDRYTELYDFAPVNYFTLLPDATIREVNLPGARLLETERGRLIEARFGSFVSPETRPTFDTWLKDVFSAQGKKRCIVTLSQGRKNPVTLELEAELSPDGTEAHAVLTDITERTLSDKKAKEASDRFRFMAEFMPQKIWTATQTGEIDFFNHQWMEFTGLSFEEIKQWGWTQFIHPDDLETTLRIYKDAIAQVKPFELEHRFRRSDGVYRWHLGRGAPMRNEKGELVMWMGSNTDIDDQSLSKIELKQTAVNLETLVQQRTQKLSETINELETYSYSISHDMRAPLRSMIGFSEILKEEYGSKLDEVGRGYLEKIGNASRRMDRLIRDILSFSKLSRQELSLKSIETSGLIKEILHTYPNLNSAGIDLAVRSPFLLIKGNETLLTQCITNLLENAVKFATPGLKPKVEIWSESFQDRVRILFRDNGIGLSAHNQERVFDIFHRVGRDTEGTGIGLAIVRKAAEKMGGSIAVTSELGKGCTFCLDLKSA